MQTVTIKWNPDFNPPKPRKRIGTRLKLAIHRVLDVLPIGAKNRRKLKTCQGCTKREKNFNAAEQRFRDRLLKRRQRRLP